LRRVGWAAVEAAFLLVVPCILLNIILGAEAGSFIVTVAKNADEFSAEPAARPLARRCLIVMIHGFLKARLQP
jgi:hypothetical protein